LTPQAPAKHTLNYKAMTIRINELVIRAEISKREESAPSSQNEKSAEEVKLSNLMKRIKNREKRER